ncbi:MAG: type II toxin-antitoxin system HicB family antitoxin [Candidatus Binatota bacterium]
MVIEKEAEGGYVVSCPAIKGCHSQGDTVEEALNNIKEAITGCLKTRNQRAKR